MAKRKVNPEIGKLLKEAREKKGLRQLAVAEAIYIDQSTLSGYEQGLRMPSPEVLAALAHYYHTSVAQFMGME